MKYTIVLFLLVSCGKIQIADSKHKVNAETKSHIYINLDYIKEIRNLCKDFYPEYENPNKEERSKLVSKCTLDKMSLIDLKAIEDFSSGVCENPETPQDIQVCEVLK